MSDVYSENRIRKVIKQELVGVKQELAGVKQDLAAVKNELTGVKNEQHRLGVLFEQIQHDIKVLIEAVSNNLSLKGRVDKQAVRLDKLETNTQLLITTVKIHSQQLKSTGGNAK